MIPLASVSIFLPSTKIGLCTLGSFVALLIAINVNTEKRINLSKPLSRG